MTDSNNYNKNLIFVLGAGFIIGFIILILLEMLAFYGILAKVMAPLSALLF